MPKVDLSEFDDLAAPKPRRACKVGIAREALAAADQANLDAAVSSGYPSGVIERWLHLRGRTEVTTVAVTMHRNKRCACAHE